MFPNLRAEMARKGLKTSDIARTLSLSEKSVSNKMNGSTEFKISEIKKLRDKHFSDLLIDYLVKQEETTEKGA